MITRHWRGRTARGDADAYQEFLRSTLLPQLDGIPGYHGADVLRRDAGADVEFVLLTRFESLDDVRAFAGEDHERAVILPEAEALLKEAEPTAAHYDTVVQARPAHDQGGAP